MDRRSFLGALAALGLIPHEWTLDAPEPRAADTVPVYPEWSAGPVGIALDDAVDGRVQMVVVGSSMVVQATTRQPIVRGDFLAVARDGQVVHCDIFGDVFLREEAA